MEKSPSWKPNKFLDSVEIPRILLSKEPQKLMVLRLLKKPHTPYEKRAHNILLMVSTHRKTNSIHTFSVRPFNIHVKFVQKQYISIIPPQKSFQH